MSKMKLKQGGNHDDAPRCPPHPGFVGGLCFLCGAKKEDAERGAPGPGVAVGHETMKQGGHGDGNDDESRCVKDEGTEGGAPGAAVGHGMMKEEGDDHGNNDDAARCPPHPKFVLGLCYRCGAAEEGAGRSASEVTVANIDEALVLPALAALKSIASASDMATLKRERKLMLVLDLDHTLLNSTSVRDLSGLEQRNGLTPHPADGLYMELFRLEYSDKVQMLAKLRPFVRGFLEQASSMFEMHVYTLGTKAYAKHVIDLLDPDGIYFGGRVVSRKESTRRYAKSLDVIRGADPAAAVILDDTDSAWPGHQDNLILIDRYHYFASTCRNFAYDIPSLAEQSRDEREHDGSLTVVLGVLKRIHQVFFDGDRADVRDVIREVRRQVIPECTVVFSYLEEYMEDFPENTLMWTLAERLGAVCKKDVDETVTHVVAEDPGTQKAQWARDKGKFLVDPEWIKAVSFRWCRVDEREFPVNTARGYWTASRRAASDPKANGNGIVNLRALEN